MAPMRAYATSAGASGNFEAGVRRRPAALGLHESCERHDERAPREQTRIVYGPICRRPRVELSKRYISLTDPDDER